MKSHFVIGQAVYRLIEVYGDCNFAVADDYKATFKSADVRNRQRTIVHLTACEYIDSTLLGYSLGSIELHPVLSPSVRRNTVYNGFSKLPGCVTISARSNESQRLRKAICALFRHALRHLTGSPFMRREKLQSILKRVYCK